jgi:regulator of protease activity HflC (stomatin/prohibitin superfamily)
LRGQQELVAAREAEARQRAAEAQGNADKLRIEAQGQADANRLINESLTPLLIQFQALQKLADNVSIALIPSGNGLIIDPATLLAASHPNSRSATAHRCVRTTNAASGRRNQILLR